MFDWPEPIHTSPTNTSSIFLSPTVSTSGPPALSGSSFTHHLPSWPAVADFVWSRNFTVTDSPWLAVPYTGTAMPRCSTMCVVKTFGSSMPACNGMARLTEATQQWMIFMISLIRASQGDISPSRFISPTFHPGAVAEALAPPFGVGK